MLSSIEKGDEATPNTCVHSYTYLQTWKESYIHTDILPPVLSHKLLNNSTCCLF